VLVADDVALAGSVSQAGRRGLAGTIFVHKIAGAVAEAGGSLEQVAAAARATAAAVRTMGVALTPCTVPAAGRPGFTLAEGEIELGLGIHGEPGVRRAPLEPADVLVARLIDAIVADLGAAAGGRVVLLVNNLGGTPTMELAVVARRAVALLEARKLAVERVYLGTFLSSLEMAGVSLTVLPVDAERLSRLDAPTDAPAWPNAAARPRSRTAPVVEQTPPTAPAPPGGARTPLGQATESALLAATNALIKAAPRLTEMDQAVGDGDLGISLERGARAIQLTLSSWPLDDPAATLHALALTLQRALGGTSGPLYAAFFLRAAAALRRGRPDDPRTWAEALQAGCTAMTELGGAVRGDRTMLDALLPAAEAFRTVASAGGSGPHALKVATAAAAAGAAATVNMLPRRGRSSYLGERALGHADPGAEAVVVWLGALGRAHESG
jgi:dihydroxyacetone kinase